MLWATSMVRQILITFLVGASALAQQKTQQKAAHPTVDQIVDRVVARFADEEKQEKAGREVLCIEHGSYDELDDDGRVKEHADTVREPVLIGDKVYMRLVSRNGSPPTGKYLDREKEREAKFREQTKKPQKKEDDEVKFDRELLSRFNVAILGEEAVGGRPAWLINVLPKPGDKPERVKLERVLNRLSGKIWIDEQDYTIAKVDLALTEPVSFYAFVGKLRSLTLKSEQRPVRDGVWAPVHMDIAVDARAMWKSVHFHEVSDCTGYKTKSELGRISDF